MCIDIFFFVNVLKTDYSKTIVIPFGARIDLEKFCDFTDVTHPDFVKNDSNKVYFKAKHYGFLTFILLNFFCTKSLFERICFALENMKNKTQMFRIDTNYWCNFL